MRIFLWISIAFLSSCSVAAEQDTWAIAIHGGAGNLSEEHLTEEQEALHQLRVTGVT